MIDMGWGDSILIESEADSGVMHYGLIDSNDDDKQKKRSSYFFLKRYFETAGIDVAAASPLFDFVLLSHAHADHASGLKLIMKKFGTERFWYPKSDRLGVYTELIRFAGRSSNVGLHQAIDNTNILPRLGDVEMSVLWPRRNQIDSKNENNNSVVLHLELDQVSLLLTGDAEDEVWRNIASEISSKTMFFKVPHHGSENGTFDHGRPAWLNECPNAHLGISCHVQRFGHPDQSVMDLFNNSNRKYYRTDLNYHVTFETDGRDCKVKYYH